MSREAFLLQGGNGGHVLDSGEGAQTGKNYRWVQCVTDTVFTNVESDIITNVAALESITHLAGTGFGGGITELHVTSGTCIAYDA